jgi:membrane fusion protein (multidrug efflux system)
MTDLSRLKISHKPGDAVAPSCNGKMAVAGLIGLVVGFSLAFMVLPRRPAEPVETTDPGVEASPRAPAQPKSFTAGGWVEVPAPYYPIVVSTRISQRLDKLLVRHGDSVKPNQELALLYDGDLKSKLLKVTAQAEEQKEALRLAKANHDRSKSMDKGVLSAEELDSSLAAFTTATERLRAAEADLDLAQKELSYCTIRAPEEPTSLKVLDVYHNPGDWISQNRGAAIVALYDPKDMQVRVDVPQSRIKLVKQGQSVTVRTEAHPDHQYAGTVARIDPLAQLAKNTITVRIKITEPDDRLFPEMVAHVSFHAK